MDMKGRADGHQWWVSATIYHVYPRSFQDSDGDGVGDLPGITSRLGALVELGVDAVWLSPIYRSPMADFGYDVSDHCDVDPLFGTLDDLDDLVAEAHRLGLRVILDYVPNHTSDQHPWFVAARSSRDDPHRDWYVWSDPAPDGGPPNNWRSEFGGPAWTLDRQTGQYYYHAYLAEQPNLNWHEPAVRAAMADVLEFWLDRGVDGFRLDAFRRLFVDRRLADEPANPAYRPGIDNESFAVLPIHTSEQPELFELAVEMRRSIDVRGDHVLLGEIYLDLEGLMRYYGSAADPGLHLPGNFTLLWTEWDAVAIAELMRTYESVLPEHGWPNWVLGNHDRPRIASRVGDAQARVAAVLLLTARGTPTIYYGDELGMRDVEVPPERVQDPWEKNVPGRGFGRDPVRAPIAWDDSANGGFTSAEPWLPMGADITERNVATSRRDPTSMWCLYHRLLALRKAEPALAIGTIDAITAAGGCLTYVRRAGGRRLLVVLEMSGAPADLDVVELGVEPSEVGHDEQRVLLSSIPGPDMALDHRFTGGTLHVRADEGLVIAFGSDRPPEASTSSLDVPMRPR